MEYLITAFYVIVCVFLFSLAIAIHEFGHFLVALKLGLRVEAFSIGFGPALWKKKIKGVEYRISAIPLGGYVSIPDVDPEGTKALEGAANAKGSNHVSAWKELVVAFAGPAMNIVLAIVIAVILALVPGAKFGELPAKLGGVFDDSPAKRAGLRAGDTVLSVGGHAVRTWGDMQTEVQISGGKAVEFVTDRGSFVVTPERDDVTGAYFIKAYSITNGVGAAMWMPDRNPIRQLAWDAGSIFRVLKGLLTPKETKATAGALGGPVMIAEGLYRQVRRDPWDGMGFLRFLNVNLAVLNLLPIPVLDGGLILFSLIAIVFRRRIPDAVIKYVSLFFMYALIGLMGILILKDSYRSYRIHNGSRVEKALGNEE